MRLNKSHSNQFLMEFLIAILFFSLSATVCIQLFVKSYFLSKESIDQNYACMWAENVAEIYNSSFGNYSSVSDVLIQSENINTSLIKDIPVSLKNDTNQLCIYFDSGWNILSQNNMIDSTSYILILNCSNDSTFQYGTIAVYTFDPVTYEYSSLYSLSIQKYIPSTLKDL